MQLSYDPFDYLNQTLSLKEASAVAKANRDCKYRQLMKDPKVKHVHRFTLKNQLEKYQSFGVEGRGYRDVYFVQYTPI